MANTKKAKKSKATKKSKAKTAKKPKAIVSEVYCAGDCLCGTSDIFNDVVEETKPSFWTKIKRIFGL